MSATQSLSADGLTLRKEKLYVTIHFLIPNRWLNHFYFFITGPANDAHNHY